VNDRPARFALFSRRFPVLLTLVAGSLGAMSAARAADPLGLYLGAAYGQAHIRAQLGDLALSGAYPLGEFDATHSAYQAMIGIRPLSFLGAEITYVDLGQRTLGYPPSASLAGAGQVPGGSNVPIGQQASQRGEGAFALLYLPVPIIDVYVKAGVARMTTDSSATYVAPGVGTCQINQPNCADFSVGRSATDTSFAYGAGLQWKLGDWAVRGEYERFSAAGANPTLLSVGMVYWIP
jgi:opacity protein-like surface antigen